MKRHHLLTAFVLSAALVAPVEASTAPYTRGTPGSSDTYDFGGITLVAYGGASPSYLPSPSGVQNGQGETGSGSNGWLQIDFSDPLSRGFSTPQFRVGSVQPGEGWAVYGSNTLGSLGTQLLTGNSEDVISLPSFTSYRYFTWTATSSDVLLTNTSLSGNSNTQVPEPGTFLLAGAALALLWRKALIADSRS